MRAAIGLCTYKRPSMLAEALESLLRLYLPENIEVLLIIVDNDSDQSAKPVLDEYQKKSRMKTYYTVEEKKGIAQARNRALKIANHNDADLMLFIDDDEIVDQNWLNAYVEYYRTHEVDVLTGPVYSSYPKDTPKWILNGGFFDTKKIQEGARQANAKTGNVMFDFKKLYGQFGITFDASLKSREDNDFFMRAKKRGAVIEWTNTAIVYEAVPVSRMKTSWLLQRVYKTGEAYSKREMRRLGFLKGVLLVLLKIPYYILRGIIMLPLTFLKGYGYFVKALQQFSIAVGMMGGLLGFNYDDYKSIHGY